MMIYSAYWCRERDKRTAIFSHSIFFQPNQPTASSFDWFEWTAERSGELQEPESVINFVFCEWMPSGRMRLNGCNLLLPERSSIGWLAGVVFCGTRVGEQGFQHKTVSGEEDTGGKSGTILLSNFRSQFFDGRLFSYCHSEAGMIDRSMKIVRLGCFSVSKQNSIRKRTKGGSNSFEEIDWSTESIFGPV